MIHGRTALVTDGVRSTSKTDVNHMFNITVLDLGTSTVSTTSKRNMFTCIGVYARGTIAMKGNFLVIEATRYPVTTRINNAEIHQVATIGNVPVVTLREMIATNGE